MDRNHVSRPKIVEVAKQYGATDIIDYHNGDIADQILELTNHVGVDKVLIAGGDAEHTFEQAVRMSKPGASIGNVAYLNGHDTVNINAGDWGVGMSNIKIDGGVMQSSRLRMEKLASLITNGRLDPSLMITHTFHGFDQIPAALERMHNKPADLIKPVIYCDDLD